MTRGPNPPNIQSNLIQEQDNEEKKQILNKLRIWLTDYQNLMIWLIMEFIINVCFLSYFLNFWSLHFIYQL